MHAENEAENLKKDTLILIFLCGIGLMCLFIGNMIIVGL